MQWLSFLRKSEGLLAGQRMVIMPSGKKGPRTTLSNSYNSPLIALSRHDLEKEEKRDEGGTAV